MDRKSHSSVISFKDIRCQTKTSYHIHTNEKSVAYAVSVCSWTHVATTFTQVISAVECLSPYLSHHAIPGPIDLLAVFAVCHQVKVVGELDALGDLL